MVGVLETAWLLPLVWGCYLWIEAGARSLQRTLCCGGAQGWDSASWSEKRLLLPLSCSWPSEHHQRVREARNLHGSSHRDGGAQCITGIITKDWLMQSITWLSGLPPGATKLHDRYFFFSTCKNPDILHHTWARSRVSMGVSAVYAMPLCCQRTVCDRREEVIPPPNSFISWKGACLEDGFYSQVLAFSWRMFLFILCGQ